MSLSHRMFLFVSFVIFVSPSWQSAKEVSGGGDRIPTLSFSEKFFCRDFVIMSARIFKYFVCAIWSHGIVIFVLESRAIIWLYACLFCAFAANVRLTLFQFRPNIFNFSVSVSGEQLSERSFYNKYLISVFKQFFLLTIMIF